MKYYQKKQEIQAVDAGYGHSSYFLLGEEHGCTNGCCAGISYYTELTYTPAAVHEDQEGFAVLSGSGWAKIGDQEFLLDKDITFIAPKGISHQMKACRAEEPLVLFWFHAKG